MAEVECVMLAAGRSSRMDAWKMTLPWGESTIIEHSVRTALNVCARVVLVAGFRAGELGGLFRDWQRVEVVKNESFKKGMFSSVQRGAQVLGSGGFFLALGDMPGVTEDIYRDLLGWHGKLASISAGEAYAVVPKYRGKKGHPLLLSPQMRTRILEAGVSMTLRHVLAEAPAVIVPVDDNGILHDIDTPADYRSRHDREQGDSR